MTTELVRYDAMCRAIAEAYAVDEVKDIRDKAIALEHYAAMARNTEAERQACEIRLRAERRCGQLLAERQMAKPRGSNQHQDVSRDPTHPQPLSELGISRDQSSQWQQLADVPEDEFEAALRGDDKPTTAGILTRANGTPISQSVDADALWLWGRLLEFERHALLVRNPQDLVETMLPHMVETTQRLAPLVADWLREIEHD
jgi:hypothetical protein